MDAVKLTTAQHVASPRVSLKLPTITVPPPCLCLSPSLLRRFDNPRANGNYMYSEMPLRTTAVVVYGTLFLRLYSQTDKSSTVTLTLVYNQTVQNESVYWYMCVCVFVCVSIYVCSLKGVQHVVWNLSTSYRQLSVYVVLAVMTNENVTTESWRYNPNI